jgi:hypothetical protein
MKRFSLLDLLLSVIFAFSFALPVSVGVVGCTAATSAYKAADNPSELAYVLLENYAALVKAAADLSEKATTPASAVTAMQQADAKAKPVMLQLRPLRDAYVASKSANSEEELQAASNRAVLAIADFVRAIQAARGTK